MTVEPYIYYDICFVSQKKKKEKKKRLAERRHVALS